MKNQIIMKKPEDVNLSISKIITHYRKNRELTLRAFAAQLSEKMPERISYQTIKNWEDGKFRPDYYKFLFMAETFVDWRRSMALEIVQALRPDLYNPIL